MNNKLHGVLVEITKYIFEVCEENDLSCIIVYGSALGGYRHKGFIPWDDDMDLAMPRDDYEKFIEIMKNKKDGFSIQNEDTEKNYFLDFAKVRKDNTLFLESAVDSLYENNGIFVDVFPLDYIDNPNALLYKVKSLYITYLKHILRFSACPNVYKAKMSKFRFSIECVISIPAKVCSKRKMLKHLHKVMKSCGSFENSNFIAQFDEVLAKQILPRECYFPVKKMEFENEWFYGPNLIEDYLRNHYGKDFMILPPLEKRVTHKPLKIKY